ncbi:MAG: hypothetical protein HRT87_02985 [Legionellales bacterium]|nr:hypothetical protein [Legionellales bacterium]
MKKTILNLTAMIMGVAINMTSYSVQTINLRNANSANSAITVPQGVANQNHGDTVRILLDSSVNQKITIAWNSSNVGNSADNTGMVWLGAGKIWDGNGIRNRGINPSTQIRIYDNNNIMISSGLLSRFFRTNLGFGTFYTNGASYAEFDVSSVKEYAVNMDVNVTVEFVSKVKKVEIQTEQKNNDSDEDDSEKDNKNKKIDFSKEVDNSSQLSVD